MWRSVLPGNFAFLHPTGARSRHRGCVDIDLTRFDRSHLCVWTRDPLFCGAQVELDANEVGGTLVLLTRTTSSCRGSQTEIANSVMRTTVHTFISAPPRANSNGHSELILPMKSEE